MPNTIHFNQPLRPHSDFSKPDHVNSPKTGSKTRGTGEQAQLKKACVELESVFIYHLLKEMRATIPDSGLMGGEGVKDMYNHMTDSHLARELSTDGGIGLSNILYQQLNKLTDEAENDKKEKID